MMRLSIRWLIAALVVAVALTGALWASRPSQAGAVINVNTTDDESNDDGDCSLREASQALSGNPRDACPAGNSLNVPAGTYVLTMGAIDIFYNGIITGAGAGSTIIDGNGNDRVFYLSSKGGPIAVTMTGLTVQNGFAEGDGGGIYVERDVTLTLNDSLATNNEASSDGGGIKNTDGTVTLNNTTVSDNTAGDEGGGVYNEGPDTLIVNDSVITGNQADEGGGIMNEFDATGSITRSTISDNFADQEGGGVRNAQCCGVDPFVITDTVISGNSTNGFGGGIDNTDEGALELTNVTISGNAAGTGGGLSNDFGTSAELTNVTIAENNTKGAGGIYNAGQATLTNTIVAGNTPGNCMEDLKPSGDITSLGHNLEATDTCGFGADGDQPNTDPMLGDLADNGGPTETHALLTGSPAIDTADDTACPDTDQRGVTRPQDGDADGTAVCDIGAVELQLEGPTPPPTETPPSEGGVVVTVSDDSPEVGDAVDISVSVTDDAGNPVAGAECTFEISDQPGDDALLEADSATTDENGIATVGLSVGSTPGTVEVTADCGAFGSEVLDVVVGVAGLPPTGAGGTGGSTSSAFAIALAVLAAAAVGGAVGFALRRS